MKTVNLISGLIVMSLMGCAHTAMRGSVAMKTNNHEAHVCLGNNEVKLGEKVTLFKNECTGSSNRATGDRNCRKVKLGLGEVTELLNEHYSVVKVDPGVIFEEGTIVETN